MCLVLVFSVISSLVGFVDLFWGGGLEGDLGRLACFGNESKIHDVREGGIIRFLAVGVFLLSFFLSFYVCISLFI